MMKSVRLRYRYLCGVGIYTRCDHFCQYLYNLSRVVARRFTIGPGRGATMSRRNSTTTSTDTMQTRICSTGYLTNNAASRLHRRWRLPPTPIVYESPPWINSSRPCQWRPHQLLTGGASARSCASKSYRAHDHGALPPLTR